MREKYIMIIGGEFENKGAQAMSFITISRLSQQFPDHKLLFISDLDYGKKELNQYAFEVIQNPFIRDNFFGENIIRKILRKKIRDDHKNSKSFLHNTEYLFDISGYALSSQWGEEGSRFYLKRFEIAQKYNIKTFILPQSIGPFEFEDEKMLEKLYAVLSNVNLIMPREIQGKEALEKINVCNNVVQIPDMVLTNKKNINWNDIYKTKIKEKTFNIEANSIAIVPNMRNLDHGDSNAISKLYNDVINKLLSWGKNVYLIKHSKEDIEACKQLKSLFPTEDRVKLISEDLTPSEFEELISLFDYSISSRFHSVVHSYKAKTPCLVLGWAIKYQELSKLFNQEKYVFDVRNNFSLEDFLSKLDYLNNNFQKEQAEIEINLKVVDKIQDPFDIVINSLKNEGEEK